MLGVISKVLLRSCLGGSYGLIRADRMILETGVFLIKHHVGMFLGSPEACTALSGFGALVEVQVLLGGIGSPG